MKYTLLFTLLVIFCYGCKKDYSCECKTTWYDGADVDTVTSDVIELTATKKSDAKTACEAGNENMLDTVYGGWITECNLK